VPVQSLTPPPLAKANGGLGHGPTSHRQGPPSLPLAPTRGRQGPHFPLWLVPEAGMGQPGPSAPPLPWLEPVVSRVMAPPPSQSRRAQSSSSPEQARARGRPGQPRPLPLLWPEPEAGWATSPLWLEPEAGQANLGPPPPLARARGGPGHLPPSG